MDNMSPAEQNELTLAIASIVDDACWTARKRYGHDDNGLDDDVDINGNPVDSMLVGYHPSAVDATRKIWELLAAAFLDDQTDPPVDSPPPLDLDFEKILHRAAQVITMRQRALLYSTDQYTGARSDVEYVEAGLRDLLNQWGKL